MFTRRKTILFIGAHPDDIVLGAGGTVTKLVGAHGVYCITMSRNIEIKRQVNLPKEDRKALLALGVKEKKISIFDFKTRYFPRDRQEICDALWQIKKKIKPDIIFTHSEHDIHQDHLVMSAEVKRVFRDKTVLGMEVARSQVGFNPQLFVEVKKGDIQKKIKAISYYKTFAHVNYSHPKVVEAVAIARGVQLEKPYIEAFEIVRYVTD
jgi:N-acetylglucosamine malate deacetylase 1